jgi:hypothetical protein
VPATGDKLTHRRAAGDFLVRDRVAPGPRHDHDLRVVENRCAHRVCGFARRNTVTSHPVLSATAVDLQSSAATSRRSALQDGVKDGDAVNGGMPKTSTEGHGLTKHVIAARPGVCDLQRRDLWRLPADVTVMPWNFRSSTAPAVLKLTLRTTAEHVFQTTGLMMENIRTRITGFAAHLVCDFSACGERTRKPHGDGPPAATR